MHTKGKCQRGRAECPYPLAQELRDKAEQAAALIEAAHRTLAEMLVLIENEGDDLAEARR